MQDPIVQTSSGNSPNNNLVKDVLMPAAIILAVVLVGAVVGWKLSQNFGLSLGKQGTVSLGKHELSDGKVIGVDDNATFRDSAEGVLVDGGIDGEGTHHLEREGGPSQNVYLTSSVVDLDQFMGKKIEVWGETIGAQKAGWLMDVGKVKIKD